MKKVTTYGKGGIGESTTTSNLSAALAARGLRIMQIGYDLKAGSTKNLMAGREMPTVLGQMRQKGEVVSLEDIASRGYGNIVCVESGGPTPGTRCVGKGTITAPEKLEELEAYEMSQPGVAFYDVLGDVICGGFTMPIRGGYTDRVTIVISGKVMVLFVANNITHAIRSFEKGGYAKLTGFTQNSRNVEGEDERVRLTVEENGTGVLHIAPRDRSVQLAENQGMTVIEAYPDSPMAVCYQALASEALEVTGI